MKNDPFADDSPAGSGDSGHDWEPLARDSSDFGPGDHGRLGRVDEQTESQALDEVHGIEIPATFKPEVWRRMLTVWHLFWDREGRVASPFEAHKAWDRIPLKTYELAALEPEFRRALELRGIDFDPSDTLSDIQHMVLMKLTDPSDRRTERAKLRDLDVSWPRYQGWLKNQVFVSEKRRRTEETFGDVQDVALMKLRGNVEAGDQRALEFALEVTGRYNRQTLAVQDARTIVQLVADAVIRNVTDAHTREAILADIRGAIVGFDLNNRKVLEQ